jgi:hypothetical protein
MAKNILDSLKMEKDMVKVNKSGKIIQYMKANGPMIRLMEKEGLFIHKEKLMRATGRTTEHMDRAHIII